MNLVSENFILFMVVTTIIYYLSPKKIKKYTLLIISIITLTCLGVENVLYILFSILITYFAGLGIEKGKYKKLILFGTVSINSLILIIMKVFPYLSEFKTFAQFNILVPLGISYYTFQVISYIIDVYRGKYHAEKNIFNFALYVVYLPYLFVGPINRFDEIKPTLIESENTKFDKDLFFKGLLKITFGFFKKLIIVSRLEVLISTITGNPSIYVGGYALLAMLLYSIQIYSDFSGAIDIVTGFSNILQIKLTSNFNLPYLATSIQDFWNRWHISLSRWFKDYLYIPLGGNRKGKLREYLNVLIVFTVSGLWHGANYILWGIFHGIFVIFDKILKNVKRKKWISIPVTFLIVSILWSFFIWPDSVTSLKMISSLFTTFNYMEVIKTIPHLGLNTINLLILFIAIIFLVLVTFGIQKRNLKEKILSKGITFKLSLLFIFITIILIFGRYGIGFNVSDFIYNKF